MRMTPQQQGALFKTNFRLYFPSLDESNEPPRALQIQLFFVSPLLRRGARSSARFVFTAGATAPETQQL